MEMDFIKDELALLTFHFSQSIRFAGAQRESMMDVVKSNGVDILVTSYHTIVSDFKKYLDTKDGEKKQGSRIKRRKTSTSIFDLVFHRIVLDEAHM
jgi:deoxyhypusine synthase